MAESKISAHFEGATSLLEGLQENLEALSHRIPASKTNYATHGLYPYVAKFASSISGVIHSLVDQTR